MFLLRFASCSAHHQFFCYVLHLFRTTVTYMHHSVFYISSALTHTRNIRDDVQQAGDPSVAALCVRDQGFSACCNLWWNLSKLAESDARREEAQHRERHHAALIAAIVSLSRPSPRPGYRRHARVLRCPLLILWWAEPGWSTDGRSW